MTTSHSEVHVTFPIQLARSCSTCAYASFNKVSAAASSFASKRFSGLCLVDDEEPRLCHRQCSCGAWVEKEKAESYARSVVKGTRKL